MIVYRLVKDIYRNELSGKGAEKYGGRWNTKGYQIIYTGESRALCTAEIAVHTPLGIVPKDYYLQTIKLPVKQSISKITTSKLEAGWKNFPHEVSTKKIGNTFIDEGKYLVLKVPSAVIQDEYNYLINPLHKDFKKINLKKVEEFKFDKRLFQR